MPIFRAVFLAALLCGSAMVMGAPPDAVTAVASAPAAGEEWLAKIRPTHPRMFLTAESVPTVRAYALEHEGKYYAALKERVAKMPAKADPATFEKGANVKYGPYAQQAAFVWLMEKDASALAKAKNYVQEGLAFYLRQSGAGRPVNWYSADRVCALTAYDWIWDQLTPEERRVIGQGFMRHYKEDMAGREGFNHGDYQTGFYGSPNLPWYIGLAFHKDGIDDAQAAGLLKKGYEDHVMLLRYRAKASGDDGGAGSLAVGYAFGMYPFAEFNFMHTFDSATGLAIEKDFPHPSLLANWAYWNRLPGGLRYGLADSVPAGEESEGSLEMQMLQIAHFWGESFPERAGFSVWFRDKVLKSKTHDDYWWPVAPLLVTGAGKLPAPVDAEASLPRARNFENMGVVFMRSGNGTSDTYAAFVAGGNVNQHRHYDQGHFILYRGGFQAIDSGDYGPRTRNDHLTEYLYRTVAHNSVLIHAPASADAPAKVWGGAARTLDGGQSNFAGRQAAFETNPSYSYAATDATRCYAEGKCKEAMRQFVFIYPDTFVICDRVTAAEPAYSKQWLLHTVGEPQIATGGLFSAAQGNGAIVCRTVFPRDAVLAKVGGPGKEFWSAEANHPQEGKVKALAGAWRVEVTPKAKRAADVFVHVIRVGDKGIKKGETSFDEIASAEAVEDGGRAGVRIKTGQGELTVTFNVAGEVGGHIGRTGLKKLDQDLTQEIQVQTGVSGKRP